MLMVIVFDDLLYLAGKTHILSKFSLKNSKTPILTNTIHNTGFNEAENVICKSMAISKNGKTLFLLLNSSKVIMVNLESFQFIQNFVIKSVYNLFLSSMICTDSNGSMLLYPLGDCLCLSKINIQKNKLKIYKRDITYSNICLFDEESRRIILHMRNDRMNVLNTCTGKLIAIADLQVTTLTVIAKAAKCYQALVSSWKKEIVLFDTKGKVKELQRISILGSPFALTVSQNKKYVGIGGTSNTLSVFEFNQ